MKEKEDEMAEEKKSLRRTPLKPKSIYENIKEKKLQTGKLKERNGTTLRTKRNNSKSSNKENITTREKGKENSQKTACIEKKYKKGKAVTLLLYARKNFATKITYRHI